MEINQILLKNQCLFCMQKFIGANKNILGLVSGTKESLLKLECLQCVDTFDNLIEFISHGITDHASSPNINTEKLLEAKTDWCLREQNQNISTYLQCSFCGQKFYKSIWGLVTGTDDGIKYELECSLCKQLFDELQEFDLHFETSHLEDFCSNEEPLEEEEVLPLDAKVDEDGIFEFVEEIETISQKDRTNYLIDLYKEHPILWDRSKVGEILKRDSYTQITAAMNKKFNCHLTLEDIKKWIFRLRTNYMKQKNTKNVVWYSEKLSFLGANKDFDITPNLTEYLIEIYKECPVLWKKRSRKPYGKNAKNECYIKMTACVKSKFNKTVTVDWIKRKIEFIRCEYKREVNRMKIFESKTSRLWYFNKLSFLQGNISENKPRRKCQNKDEIDYLINLYKQHPILWDRKSKGHKCKRTFGIIYNKIMDEFNAKFNCDLTVKCIRNMILQIVHKYKTERYNMKATNRTKTKVWYLDKLSFIEETKTFRAFTRSQCEYLIDLYKKHPVLWDFRLPKFKSELVKTKAYEHITKLINEKFNLHETPSVIDKKLSEMRRKFEKEFTDILNWKKRTAKLWFFDKFSFITLKRGLEELKNYHIISQSRCQSKSQRKAISDRISSSKKIVVDEFEWKNERTEYLLDLYKQHPLLWDTNMRRGSWHRIRAYSLITEAMNEQFNLGLTSECVKMKIRFLRDMYKRELAIWKTVAKEDRTKPVPWILDRFPAINVHRGSPIEKTLLHDEINYMIELLKEHSILWNTEINGRTNKFKKAIYEAYSKITQILNEKFNKELTVTYVRNKISYLRCECKRQSKRMKMNKTKGPKFCFFEKLSFLDMSVSESEIENRDQMKYLIEMYKKYPILWQCQLDRFISKKATRKASVAITDAMNTKFNKNWTVKQVQRMISKLIFRYKTDLKRMEIVNDTKSNLWYFEMFSFIEKGEIEIERSMRKEHIDYLIDLYKQYPILWNYHLPEFVISEDAKEKANNEITKAMNEKFNMQKTTAWVKKRLLLLRLRFQNDLHKKAKWKVQPRSSWFVDKLSFIALNDGIDELYKHRKLFRV